MTTGSDWLGQRAVVIRLMHEIWSTAISNDRQNSIARASLHPLGLLTNIPIENGRISKETLASEFPGATVGAAILDFITQNANY